MYKIISILLFVFPLLLTGCGNQHEKTPVEPVRKLVIKVAHTEPISHPRHQAMLKFKDIVETNTNKEVEVQIFPDGQLGSQSELIEMVKSGNIQAVASNAAETAAPELRIYSLPFLFSNMEAAHRITRGPLGKRISQATQRNQLLVLSTGDSDDFSNIINNLRPIYKPADMQGLMLNVRPLDTTLRMLTVFNAVGISVSPAEQYALLQNKQLNGQEVSLANPSTLNLTDDHQYLTLLNYQYRPAFFLVNLEWYNSLPTAYRNVIKVAAEEMMLYNDELLATQTKNNLALLQKKVKVNTLTQEQRKRFLQQARPVYQFYTDNGLVSRQDLDEIWNTVE